MGITGGLLMDEVLRRVYSIVEEPMKCPKCKIIMQIQQAHPEPDDDGNNLCFHCLTPLEAVIHE